MGAFDGARRAALVAALSSCGAFVYGVCAGQPARPRASALRPGRVLRVGASQRLTRPSEAARVARAGDVVEIEAGDYAGDVAVWPQARLTIRAVGGPVRLHANGRAAEGKAIWVIRDGSFDVEGFEFVGARVASRNGAGIRFEGGRLSVRLCRFVDNECGILTSNDGKSELELDRCEFEGIVQPGAGFTHNLYVGRIARFQMRGCWSHRGGAGHLVKTRARESFLYCNRLSDEPGGQASYELDAPNGGLVVALGNLLAQEPTNRNHTLLSFGAEGYRWPMNRLVLAHNTFANRGPIGVYARVYPGAQATLLENNLLAGEGLFDGVEFDAHRGNFFSARADFVDPDALDYRLRPGSALRERAVRASQMPAVALAPGHEYVHPLGLRELDPDAPRAPGAYQT